LELKNHDPGNALDNTSRKKCVCGVVNMTDWQNLKDDLEDFSEISHRAQILENVKKSVEIIHVYLFTPGFEVVLFRRSDGFWMPVSGKVEPEETHICASVRELQEETGLVLDLNQVMMTEHTFSGLSPKGKLITGKTCWAIMNGPLTASAIKFNGELDGFLVLSPEGAVRLLKNRGMAEAKEGLVYLLGEIL
jgi:8-oxo-dGTP pyrophosphatase MutT (NUDIX family)